jgi:Tol biopolymer transport system component
MVHFNITVDRGDAKLKIRVSTLLVLLFMLSACGANVEKDEPAGQPANQAEAPKQQQSSDENKVEADAEPNKESTASGRIYFMRDHYIYSVKPDGSDEKQLTDTGMENKPDSYPAVSSDGKQVVYANGFSKIYTIPADGGEEVEVANQLQASSPVFSPDGLHVAYDMDYLGTYAIAVSSTETFKFEGQYGRAYNPRAWPHWSPDGESIMATELADGGSHYKLVLINVATKEYEDIIDDPDHSYFSAIFSPDGQSIACIRSKAGEEEYSLSVMNSDGTGGRELVNQVDHNRPAWSPDGSSLAFQKGNAIYRIPVSGGEPELMIENATAPAWGQ